MISKSILQSLGLSTAHLLATFVSVITRTLTGIGGNILGDAFPCAIPFLNIMTGFLASTASYPQVLRISILVTHKELFPFVFLVEVPLHLRVDLRMLGNTILKWGASGSASGNRSSFKKRLGAIEQGRGFFQQDRGRGGIR